MGAFEAPRATGNGRRRQRQRTTERATDGSGKPNPNTTRPDRVDDRPWIDLHNGPTDLPQAANPTTQKCLNQTQLICQKSSDERFGVLFNSVLFTVTAIVFDCFARGEAAIDGGIAPWTTDDDRDEAPSDATGGQLKRPIDHRLRTNPTQPNLTQPNPNQPHDTRFFGDPCQPPPRKPSREEYIVVFRAPPSPSSGALLFNFGCS